MYSRIANNYDLDAKHETITLYINMTIDCGMKLTMCN